MADFLELDFLPIGKKNSGDAITIRYSIDGIENIHIVDGGYTDDGKSVCSHVDKYYGKNKTINHLVVTHPDRDHAGGIKFIIDNCDVGVLWMNRPWIYASEIIDRFSRFSNVNNLEQRLRDIYPYVHAAEKAAQDKGIEIREAFQGSKIGDFTVLAPSKQRLLDLIVESDKSPQIAKIQESEEGAFLEEGILGKLRKLAKALWGQEDFSGEKTAAENEMSVVQYANICGSRVLLTGDAGREALEEAVNYAPIAGIAFPGIDKFQIPHHGSRRNVSTELLNAILGERLQSKPEHPGNAFTALVSAAKEDPDHPRNAVIRAIWHRGGQAVSTEGISVRSPAGDAPPREGWTPVTPIPYPDEQEE
ncbi:ComEC/Rec2 family competence protein [Hoeflea alexandrii]|uniref:ComEC/Rec2 family competence protein n=1 Tax=Hoeflea alexandrii TaxID=288436 RepID=UPI0022B01968|nr:competence protein ComEC [Hoeflea alexandrii]MCZ4289941.1 competence protein ComEC [Hoeflea alexandrii]